MTTEQIEIKVAELAAELKAARAQGRTDTVLYEKLTRKHDLLTRKLEERQAVKASLEVIEAEVDKLLKHYGTFQIGNLIDEILTSKQYRK